MPKNMRRCKPTISDESTPEEDRIYSPNKTCWCRKTSKESSDLLFRNIEQMKKNLETRGTQRIVLQRDDWQIKCAGELPLISNPDFRIDVHYIYDGRNGGYRMYAEDTKYRSRYDNIDETGEGELQEIVYLEDKDKEYFGIRNVDELRIRWDGTHYDDDDDMKGFIGLDL